jgi:hypothetical protein
MKAAIARSRMTFGFDGLGAANALPLLRWRG